MARTKPPKKNKSVSKQKPIKRKRKRSGRKTAPKRKKGRFRNTPPKAKYYPMGGHLKDPPKNCSWRRQATDGGIWTDLACCMSYCDDKCERFKWNKKASNRERMQDLINRGCKNIYIEEKKAS